MKAPNVPSATLPFTMQVTVPASHPAIPGHFPGMPVVPGVVLLQLVLDAARAAGCAADGAGRIGSAKFLQPVRPDTPLEVRLAAGGGTAIAFEIVSGGGRVAAGTLDLSADAPR